MRTRLKWNWVQVAILVWVLSGLGLAVYSYVHPHSHTVYPIYEVAARNWWKGKDLYVRGEEYYRYSPLFAIGVTPFAVLPECSGNPLWKVATILIYALGLAAWVRCVLPARLSRTQAAILFLFALPTALHSLYIGQANMIMVSAMLCALGATAQKRWNQAAAWLALATLIKVYPVGLALILAVQYPRRFAPRFAAALGIGLLLPFAAQTPRTVIAQYASWFRHLHDSEHIMRERLRSIDNLLQVYGHPISPHAFALLGLMTGAAVLGLCMLFAWRVHNRKEQLTQTFLLFASWVVLFGPATEACTYATIAPALAWALVESFSGKRRWVTGGLLLTSMFLNGILPAFVRGFIIDHGGQPIGGLLFVAYCLKQMGKTPTTETECLAEHPEGQETASVTTPAKPAAA